MIIKERRFTNKYSPSMNGLESSSGLDLSEELECERPTKDEEDPPGGGGEGGVRFTPPLVTPLMYNATGPRGGAGAGRFTSRREGVPLGSMIAMPPTPP